jgi:hypothetical protein
MNTRFLFVWSLKSSELDLLMVSKKLMTIKKSFVFFSKTLFYKQNKRIRIPID